MTLLVYISTLASVVATVAGGFFVYRIVSTTPPTNENSIAGQQALIPIIEPLPAPDASVSPTPEANEQTSQPTAETQAATSVQRTVTPTPRPSPTPRPAVAGATDEAAAIEFIDLPTAIHHREGFTIAWKVSGPDGTRGENTTLTTRFHAKNDSEGSKVSVNNDTSNSFGSFTVPKTFSSKFKFGGVPGTVEIVVTAEINGQTLREERSITLTE